MIKEMRRVRRGFSLVELLLATVCLAGSATGVLAALRYANDKTTLSRQRGIALQYACSQIEDAESQAANSTLVAGVQNFTTTLPGIPVSVSTTRTVAQIPSTQLYTVNVQVNWTLQVSGGTQSQSILLDTVVWYGNAG